MPKFLFGGSYTPEGVRGVMKDKGSGRKAVVEKLLASLGGKLESIHFALGEEDVFVIAELPDSVSAAALGMAISASGALRGKTVSLLTVDEATVQGWIQGKNPDLDDSPPTRVYRLTPG
jgi:uncharacterized protein with GYD domain